MRRYLTDAAAKDALEKLDERLDRAALERQVERDFRRFGAVAAAERVAEGKIHRLWSNGAEDDAFRNNHECWEHFGTVG